MRPAITRNERDAAVNTEHAAPQTNKALRRDSEERRDCAAPPARRRRAARAQYNYWEGTATVATETRRAPTSPIESELKTFRQAPERKEKCMGTVYANERGLPMFRRGKERNIRECFRVRSEEGSPALSQAKVCWRRVITRFRY